MLFKSRGHSERRAGVLAEGRRVAYKRLRLSLRYFQGIWQLSRQPASASR
jgi:hypothetical protein